HLLCDASKLDGCPRCRLPASRLCCDIHNSPEFRRLSVPKITRPNAPARSKVESKRMDDKDSDLYSALDTWRENKTVEVYGWAALNDSGPMLVMPASILTRILDCARAGLLESKEPEDLRRETRWDEADRYGEDVLAIVHRIRPPVVPEPIRIPTPPPLPASIPTFTLTGYQGNNQAITEAQTEGRKQRSCTRCGTPGHNGSSATKSFELTH
ncbi:hypothetical protein BKA70DRAFT_1119271, partial [Coprinopsis sp. MPI-PUGE-AT-0042]